MCSIKSMVSSVLVRSLLTCCGCASLHASKKQVLAAEFQYVKQLQLQVHLHPDGRLARTPFAEEYVCGLCSSHESLLYVQHRHAEACSMYLKVESLEDQSAHTVNFRRERFSRLSGL